ncbi:MAG: hypothetical protein K0S07_1531 [Chlamydiales bacterium]|nr:hypothetical protein [Chlamydiales bacterium]
MKTLDTLSLVLVILGALNWGLVGFWRLDLVAGMFDGATAPMSRIIYGLVGLAGVYSIRLLFR